MIFVLRSDYLYNSKRTFAVQVKTAIAYPYNYIAVAPWIMMFHLICHTFCAEKIYDALQMNLTKWHVHKSL